MFVRARSLGESSSVRSLLFVSLPLSLLLMLGGCRERGNTIVMRDACSLVSKEEVASVQEAPVNETKSSEHSDGVFRVSQCFYTAAEFSKSVILALVQPDSKQRSERSPKDFWREKFGPYNGNQKERDEKPETKSAEKEQGPAPKKIDGLGDDAYWVSNRFGGVLYVLKGDTFFSVGIGGTDDEDAKLEKSKVLAQKALQHL